MVVVVVGGGVGGGRDSLQLPVFSPCDFKEEMRNLAEDLLPPETRPAISNSYRPFVTEGAPARDQAGRVEKRQSGVCDFAGGCDECSLTMGMVKPTAAH